MKLRPSAALLRLICLLFVSLGLIGLVPKQLFGFGCLLSVWLLAAQSDKASLVFARIWRMRWFFLAIALLYGIGHDASAPWDSLLQAVYRVGVLVCLVCLVTICLDDIPAAHLAAALQRLLSPLSVFGLPVAAFSRRLALSLQTVQLMDTEIQRLRGQRRQHMLNGLAKLCLDAETKSPAVSTEAVVAPMAGIKDAMLLACLVGGLILIRSMV